MSETTLEQPRVKREYRTIREDTISHHEKTPGAWIKQGWPIERKPNVQRDYDGRDEA